MHTLFHWLLNNGVGQNVTAGVIMGAAGITWAHIKIVKPMRQHHQLLRTIHHAEWDKFSRQWTRAPGSTGGKTTFPRPGWERVEGSHRTGNRDAS